MAIDSIHSNFRDGDVELVAVSFSIPEAIERTVVKLIPKPLVEAENLALGTLGISQVSDGQPVGYVRQRAVGFPAWPVMTDPDNAQHALNLVADVEWARRQAKSRADAVKKRSDELVATLQATAPHFLPTFLEEIARIFDETGHESLARQYFGRAREIERMHGLDIDTQRHSAVFQEFAERGIVGARELSAEAKDARARMEPAAAYEYFFGLLLTRAKQGGGTYANVFRDIAQMAKNAGIEKAQAESEFVSEYILTRSFKRTPEKVLSKFIPVLKKAIELRPGVREKLLTEFPDEWRLSGYMEALRKSGLWEELNSEGTLFADWFTGLFESQTSGGLGLFFHEVDEDLLVAIQQHSESIRAKLDLMSEKYEKLRLISELNWDLVEAFHRIGLTWRAEPVTHIWSYGSTGWINNGHLDLHSLTSDKDLLAAMARSLRTDDVVRNLDRFFEHESSKRIISTWLDQLAESQSECVGELEAWEGFYREIKALDDPRFFEVNPRAVERIFGFNAAEQLMHRLHHGYLVEYRWDVFEQLVESISAGTNSSVVPSFPEIFVSVDDTMHVIDSGERVETFALPRNIQIRYAAKIGEQTLCAYHSTLNWKSYYLWSEEGIGYPLPTLDWSEKPVYGWDTGTSKFYGAAEVKEDQIPPAELGFSVFGTGPHYAPIDQKGKSGYIELETQQTMSAIEFTTSLISGKLPGIDVGGLDFSSIPNEALLDPTESYFLPYEKSSQLSPCGSLAGTLVSLEFSNAEEIVVITPLGAFRSDSPGYKQNNYMQSALKKPGTANELWGYKANRLCNEETRVPLDYSRKVDGTPAALDRLPQSGYHHLTERNAELSKALRIIDLDQAAKILEDPAHIEEIIDAKLSEIDQPLVDAIAYSAKLCRELEQRAGRVLEEMTAVGATNIDVPPALSEDALLFLRWKFGWGDWNEFSQYAGFAKILNGEVTELRENGYWNDISTSVIGQERAVLNALASPMMEESLRSELLTLFKWLAEVGFLGQVDARKMRTYKVTGSVLGASRVLQIPTSYGGFLFAWPPEHADQAWKILTELEPEVEKERTSRLFLEKEEFTQGLDAIREYFEDSEAADITLETVFQRAEELFKLTGLPAMLWRCALADPTPKRFSGSDYRFQKEDLAPLGMNIKQVEWTRRMAYHLGLDRLVETMRNPLRATPEIDEKKFLRVWKRQLGEPWKLFSEEECAEIAAMLSRRAEFDFLIKAESALPEESFIQFSLFYLLLELAQNVSPGTSEAEVIKRKLEVFRLEKSVKTPVVLGSDFTKVGDRTSALDVTTQLFAEGHMDRLLAYLDGRGTKPNESKQGDGRDPLNSAPETAAQVQEKLSIGEAAARYFLQLLALANPTDADIKKINGWKKKDLDSVISELEQAELIVKGKRTGRTAFLPGGWLDRSNTGPGMETWKAPHFLVWADTKCRPVIPGAPLLVPYADQFADVWERYDSGDKPNYEELRTAAYKRKR